MSSFTYPYTTPNTPVFFASQNMVPGEPIFLIVQADDSEQGKESAAAGLAALEWVQGQLDQVHRDGADLGILESQVMLPGMHQFIKCEFRIIEEREPGNGPTMQVVSLSERVLWSGDL